MDLISAEFIHESECKNEGRVANKLARATMLAKFFLAAWQQVMQFVTASGRLAISVFIVSAILLAIFVIAENEMVHKFQECIRANTVQNIRTYDSENTNFIGLRAQAICTIRTIDKHNGFFGLLATVVIAAFTVILAIVTNRQAVLTNRALALAREEFNATHRPHIIFRDIFKDGDSIFYSLVNNGDAPGIIIESWILLEFIPDGRPLRPLLSLGHDDLGKESFGVGEMKQFTYHIDGAAAFYMIFPEASRISVDDNPPVHGQTYFTGTIVYSDNGGQRRRTVFRRRWVGGAAIFSHLGNGDLVQRH